MENSLRIVGGSHRGRALQAPGGRRLRPTADRTREAVFNMLVHRRDLDIDGAAVLDLFAGTGALGLEALSRGAGHATFVENDRAALACLRGNAHGLEMEAAVAIVRGDATRYDPGADAPRGGYPLVFLDPPYGRGLVAAALANLVARDLLAPGATVVAETGDREAAPAVDGVELLDTRRYGAARIFILRRTAEPID